LSRIRCWRLYVYASIPYIFLATFDTGVFLAVVVLRDSGLTADRPGFGRSCRISRQEWWEKKKSNKQGSNLHM
jgi:hypothetical protein